MSEPLVTNTSAYYLGHSSNVFTSSVQITSVLSFAVMSLELKTIRVSQDSVATRFQAYLMKSPLVFHNEPCFLLFQRTLVMTIMTMVRRKRMTTAVTVTTRLKRLAREGRRPLKGKELQVSPTTFLA